MAVENAYGTEYLEAIKNVKNSDIQKGILELFPPKRKVHEILEDKFDDLIANENLSSGEIIHCHSDDAKELILSTYGTIQECYGDGIEIIRQEDAKQIGRYLHWKDGKKICLGAYIPKFADLPAAGRFKSDAFDLYKQQLQEANAWEEGNSL